MLTKYGPMRRSVMIMWVAGEEKGLWGSAAWTRNPTLPEGYKAVADINIDMIGRNAPEKLTVTPSAEHESYNFLSKLAVKLSPEEGFPTLDSADQYYTRSDHYNFVQAGIPATFLFAGVHEDYHRPTDDPEKIDYDKIRRVVRLVFRMLADLQNDSMG
jgi:Zn-dependent M28 family amino/carboxypeptidase